MKVSIMQPYFFPYIGYWQLLHAANLFVVYDDVNFIKQGYINRNSILINGQPHLITLEVLGASSNKFITNVSVGKNINKILKTIELNYKRAPYFQVVFPLIEEILLFEEKNLPLFLYNSIQRLTQYMHIEVNFILSSELKKDNSLKGQDKIIHILKILEASHYINAIGGQKLYHKKRFAKEGIILNFLKTKNITYSQFDDVFIPNLSIIDVLMFNSQNDIKKLLNSYELI